jgi:hypothetical protein
MALLGFAAGGMLAPLRAMGWAHPLCAVDIDDQGFNVFRDLCGSWCGNVRLEQAEACAWLHRQPGHWDALIEDLSVPHEGDIIKPECVWSALPPLMAHALAPGGTALCNLLHPGSGAWDHGLQAVARPFGPHATAHVVHLGDFENRLLITSTAPLPSRSLSFRMKSLLQRIGSRQAGRFSIRALRRAQD